MTNIIVGQNISGSLTSTNPTIVDPTSPFNGQFYDDFDLSSINVIDPNNLPFLLAANKELGDIGSVKIGETQSTNIFVQPPAGSAPGASTTIQLINTLTNSVDAQATSSSSEALKFVKNAEIAGTNYKIRVINAIPGDYQISLAGAIQAVQVVGTTGTTTTDGKLNPTLNPPITGFNGTNNLGGQPATSGGGSTTDPIIDPVIVSQPNPTPPTPVNGGGFTGGQPATVDQPATSGGGSTTDPIIDPVITSPPNPTPPPTGGNVTNNPGVNAGAPATSGGGTDPIIDPSLSGVDPVIFQNAVGGNPPPPVLSASGGGGNPAPGANNGGLFPGSFSNIVLNNNFFTTTAATGFGISAVSQKAGSKVSEIGVFAVDDATGKIGGIAPGAAGYLQAIGNSARSIFSTLGGSFFDSSSKREIALDPNKIYGFFQVQDGSIADLKQQLLGGQVPTNILSSLADDKGNVPIKVTSNSTTGGYNVSVNNDELVLSVVKLDGATPNVAIGAKSQGLAEGRTIDLTGVTGPLKVDITTKSSAAYNNNIGFYAVEDSIGTIKLADGKTVKPGDVNYAVEAIKNALTNSSLQAGKTDSKLGQDITGGRIYAPVVVSQGSLSDFIATNPTNIGGSNSNAYFNYVLGNSDKQDHFRLLGDNTFGVEDQLGGGDRDFNDLVVNMNVKPA
jgi:hypothetical protein